MENSDLIKINFKNSIVIIDFKNKKVNVNGAHGNIIKAKESDEYSISGRRMYTINVNDEEDKDIAN